ncbi:hypothetical protein D3C84_1019120 [compost metagenome]
MLACIPLAIITVRPNTVENWLTSIFLVLPVLWFVFICPKFLDGWLRHSRYGFPSWVILALKLALFFWVIKVVEPYTASLLSEWLKA